MTIDFEKPQPLMVDGRPHFTLSSYAPVSITLSVPALIDEFVESTIDSILAGLDAGREKLEDSDWVHETLQCDSAEQFRQIVRGHLKELNDQVRDENRKQLAVEELSLRLQQSVPESYLERARLFVQENLERQLAYEGRTIGEFARDNGLSTMDLDAWLNNEARAAAEQQAALGAYAREKKLTVDDSELGDLLGLPEEGMEEYIELAKEDGTYDVTIDAALAEKAARAVADEAKCTYHYETEEEARRRFRNMKRENQ